MDFLYHIEIFQGKQPLVVFINLYYKRTKNSVMIRNFHYIDDSDH